MAAILLVEDDHTLGMTLELSLRSNGHQVHWSHSLADARLENAEHSPDLIVLDLGLPDGDGLELCHELREQGSIAPILILSARSTLTDRVDGLSVGGDDYLTKPFELPELLARIEALLRRQGWHGGTELEVVKLGRLEVDFRTREARSDGEPIPLTELEFKLIRYLFEHAGRVIPREELLSEVWGLPEKTQTRTVDVFVSRLRRHLEPDTSRPRHLFNIRGVGYRLILSDE